MHHYSKTFGNPGPTYYIITGESPHKVYGKFMHVSQPIRRLMQDNTHTFGGFSFLLQHSHTTNSNPNPSGGFKGHVVEQKT